MLLEFLVYLRAEEVDVCGEGDGLVEAVDAAVPLLVVEPHPLVTIVQPLNHQTRGAAAGVPAGWTAGPRCGVVWCFISLSTIWSYSVLSCPYLATSNSL